MNLALRQIDADLGKHNADSFHEDLHKQLKADFILANPPFNVSDWGGDRLQEDVRWNMEHRQQVMPIKHGYSICSII